MRELYLTLGMSENKKKLIRKTTVDEFNLTPWVFRTSHALINACSNTNFDHGQIKLTQLKDWILIYNLPCIFRYTPVLLNKQQLVILKCTHTGFLS